MVTSLRAILLFLFLSFAVSTIAQVTANFTADVTSGCAPLVVNFTNTSTGATTYHWYLNNGSPMLTQQNVSGSFLNPGTYTVKLVAINGSDSNTKTMTITAYPPPTVNFIAQDTAVCPGTAVSFTDNTTANASGTMTFQWNFGDGSNNTNENPTHTFPSSGYYNITLVATNGNGCVGNLTKTNYIHVYSPASPSFGVNNTYFCAAPATATFNNQTTGIAPLSYQWHFGDGGSSTDVNPTHTYSATGVYTVTLVVTDGNGCIDSLKRNAYINVGHQNGNFNAPASVCVNQTVHFYDLSPIHVNTTWHFGDGGTASIDTPAHIFTTPGTYQDTMIVFDGYCYDTVIKPITINPGPDVSYSFTPAHPCPAPFTLNFNSTGPSGTTYHWLFGDGGSDNTADPTHTYLHNGVDTIRLIVTNGNGCIDTMKQIDTFYNLLTGIGAPVDGGCVPTTMHFNTYHLTNRPDTTAPPYTYPFPVTYSWTFGDGSAPVTDSAPSHTYTAPGTYTVTITLFTSNGCSITDSAQVHIGTPPTPDFTYLPAHICADRSVYFTNTSSNATNYVWDFGDGDASSDISAVHQYQYPGVYTVKLIAYNNGCPDSLIDSNIITVDSPHAALLMSPNCDPRTLINFIDSSIGATSFIWIFGDGDTSTELNPAHLYPSVGSYTVELATYNSTTGCRDTSKQDFSIFNPTVNFTANDTAVCRDAIVHITPSILNGASSSYMWFVNGIPVDTAQILIDTFVNSGLYSIELSIIDNYGCTDTVSKTNYITVAQPVDSFVASPTNGCWPLTVEFTDYSTDVGTVIPTSWEWLWGDGTNNTVATATTTHTYTQVGPASVTEIVTDNLGCKDTLQMPQLIQVNRPNAAFFSPIVTPCAGTSVHFTNTTAGTVQSSYWFFGDGDTSTAFSPSHTYDQPGNYTVKLIVTDNNGCVDTATYTDYIKITKPTAGFTLSDTFTVCPPLLEQFTNISTNAASYLWLFGNTNTSTAANPSNDYTASGYYTVMLIAKDIHGCTDTATAHVSIYGYSGAFTYTPTIGCNPLTVAFTANVNQVSTVIWDFSDGNTLSATNGDTVTHTYTVPGAYVPKLVLRNDSGCQNSSTGLDTIKVDAVIPGYKTTPPCIDESVTFEDTTYSYFSSAAEWHWTFNNDNTDTSDLQNATQSYSAIGSYPVTLIVTDALGCKDTLSDSVLIHGLPTITAAGDTTVCVGDAAQVSGAGGVSYSWAPAGSVSCVTCQVTNASPTSATEYIVTGTDVNGCTNTDSVLVQTKTLTVAYPGANQAICLGENVTVTDSGAQVYTWYPATHISDDHSGSPSVYPTATTTYMVIARDGSCIPDTGYITVVVHPLPTVNAGTDQQIVAGQSTVLHGTASGAVKYLWKPGVSLDCDSCLDPTATPGATTTYVLTGYTDYDCEDSSKTTVHVVCDNNQVFIPNTFTPNGDGQNDIFYPRGTGISKISSFRIYNRWGEVLFERTNIDINDAGNGWDGSYKGGTPRPDVYVYIVDAICSTGEPMTLKGDVTIIR